MILPDTLAPLPVAEDAVKAGETEDFVSESAIRQLLVGPMAVVASGMRGDVVDFAGRPDLGEEMLFSIPREARAEAKPMARRPHPAFVPGERRAAPPVPRSRAGSDARPTSMKGIAVVIGTGLAASILMTWGWFLAFPEREHGAFTIPAVRTEKAAEPGLLPGEEAAGPLLVRRQWDIGAP